MRGPCCRQWHGFAISCAKPHTSVVPTGGFAEYPDFLENPYSAGSYDLNFTASYSMTPSNGGQSVPMLQIFIGKSPWGFLSSYSGANLNVSLPLTFSGAGTVLEPFTLSGDLDVTSYETNLPGYPPPLCPQYCTDWQLLGAGTAQVVLAAGPPGATWFTIQQIDLGFKSVPTPSTGPLLLVGLLALGVRSRRRIHLAAGPP